MEISEQQITLKTILQAIGYQVICSNNIAFLQKNIFNVALIDIHSDSFGQKCVSMIAETKKPVIIMTSYEETELEKMGFLRGTTKCVKIPLSINSLLSMINTSIAKEAST